MLVGVDAIFRSWRYLVGHEALSPASMAAGLVLIAGISLVVGFLTPVGAAAIVLTGLIAEVTWFRGVVGDLLDPPGSIKWLAAVAAALTLLGPGWFSLDSLIFGRRDIIVPRFTDPARER